MTWLLLSDTSRIIVLSIDLQGPGLDPVGSHGTISGNSPLMADHQLGNQFGKLVLADFVFNHRQALLLFDLAPHASILSLTSPRRDDVPNVKFSDSRGFAQSPGHRYFALLLRAKGQDQVTVFTPKDATSSNHVTFSPQTSDAQGLMWSPDGDPMIAVWDSPAYGKKISFFTAMGHPLKQFDVSSENLHPIKQPMGIEGIGITRLAWVATNNGTVIAVADGYDRVVARYQHHRTMVGRTSCSWTLLTMLETLQSLANFKHADIVDGSKSTVWEEQVDGTGTFTLNKNAFEAPTGQSIPQVVNAIELNVDCTFIATTLENYLKAVWLWQPYRSDPHTVIVFRENIKQILWHPTLPNVLLVITNQKRPMVYMWYQEMLPPAAGEIPVSNTQSNKWEVQWVNESEERRTFMLASTKSFDIGSLRFLDGQFVFDSILHRGYSAEADEDDGETEVIVTPSKSRQKTVNHVLRADKKAIGHAEERYTRW